MPIEDSDRAKRREGFDMSHPSYSPRSGKEPSEDRERRRTRRSEYPNENYRASAARESGDDDRSEHSEQEDEGPHYRGIHSRSIGRTPGGGLRISESYLVVGPFTGRGPKGYQRSDEKICDDVNERLERHGDLDASEIEVSCEAGVVTLKGKVDDRASKRRAEECAEDVYGVKDVMNEIRVDAGFFERLFGSDDAEADEARSRGRSRTGKNA
jgi:hypothetical protein